MSDLAICVIALAPVALTTGVPSATPLARREWWLLVASLSLLYWLHAYIWHYPKAFSDRCARAPLALLAPTPVKVFGRLEIVGKVQQITSLVLYWGVGATRRGFEGLAEPSRVAHSLCGVALIAAGQALNGAVYKAIGEAGVYYGFKLGETVPWCTGFPFSLGLRHPQYVGVALTLIGIAVAFAPDASFVADGMLHAFLVWASFYIVMSRMESSGDNDSEPTKKGK